MRARSFPINSANRRGSSGSTSATYAPAATYRHRAHLGIPRGALTMTTGFASASGHAKLPVLDCEWRCSTRTKSRRVSVIMSIQ